MAAKKHSDDYIPMPGEIEAQREAMHEYWRTHEDPRHDYIATYTLFGQKVTEKVTARTAQDAEEITRKQLSMIGAYPNDLTIEFDKEGN